MTECVSPHPARRGRDGSGLTQTVTRRAERVEKQTLPGRLRSPGVPLPRVGEVVAVRRCADGRLDGVCAFLAGADADETVDVGDPDLPVADLAGRGRGDDRVDDGVDVAVFGGDFDSDLGDEVALVLGSSERLGVPAPAAGR